MTSTAPYEVKSPSAVLAEDVICQSFIQSSSTLAYACLLIRRGRHDLAAHVLHSLEAKPASRFKDMVLYLQCQIGIETGDFAEVKRRLVPRVHQHPGDMVAICLLQSCVFLEWEDWQRSNPDFSAPTFAEEPAGIPAEDPVPGFRADPSEPSPAPSYHTLPVPTVPSREAGAHADPGRAADPALSQPYMSAPGSADFGIFQSLAADPNTHALCLWEASQRKLRSTGKRPDLEPLVAAMPELFPSGLREAVRSLEGGEIHKICFSFQGLTVTSLHAGSENLGLVTGNMNQSLLTMVRAENIFLKGIQNPGAQPRAVGAVPQ